MTKKEIVSEQNLKNIHNGIETSIIQMMVEGCEILKKVYKLQPNESAKIFEKYNHLRLNSYLFEKMSIILSKKDENDNKKFLVDSILDKDISNTNKENFSNYIENFVPFGISYSALETKNLSKSKALREKLGNIYNFSFPYNNINLKHFIGLLESTFFAGFILIYSQELAILKTISDKNNLGINIVEVISSLQENTTTKSKILEFVLNLYKNNSNVENILEIKEIKEELLNSLQDYKTLLTIALNYNVATPVLSSALNYFYSIINKESTHNFTIAMNNYLGKSNYLRIDKDGEFNTIWE